MTAAQKKIAALEAERDRYKKALERIGNRHIVKPIPEYPPDRLKLHYFNRIVEAEEIARTALGGKEE